MTLQGKVAIVTGGNTGIGKAVVLALGRRGRLDRHRLRGRPRRDRGARATGPGPRGQGDRGQGRRQQGRRPRDADRHGGEHLRAARHHGQQRRHRDPDLGARHHRGPVRPGARHQPEERLLRHAAGGQADDRPGRRGPDHQHDLGPRGLAHARQHRLLPLQGRHADADPHGGRGAGSPQRPGGRGRPRGGGHPDQQGHRGRPRKRWPSSTTPSPRADWPSPRRSGAWWPSWPGPERAI